MVELKYQERCCYNCRYYRIWKKNINYSSECLLLGRTLSLVSLHVFLWSDGCRYCDLFKKRPSTWSTLSETNPYWSDTYYKRKTLERLRKKYHIDM